jgi:hypothetical protein
MTEMTELTAPRFAFLGFCDRAEIITKGHQIQWHENIMGFSRSRLYYFFPVNLRGQKIVTAVFQPRVGEKFKLIFRSVSTQKEFEIVNEISGVVASERLDSQAAPQHTDLEQYSGGWLVAVQNLEIDVFVYERGTYQIYLSSELGEICLGEVWFWSAEVPPFTAQDIAAIKSNPFASKLVRVEFKCKLCGESLRVYAGLERSQRLEAEGYLWNMEINHDRFKCNCGTHDFSLDPIKHGLHGLLRQTFTKPIESSEGAMMNSVRLYEDSALQEYCRLFQELIDASPGEEKVQDFLEKHEIFFASFLPQKLLVKPPILTKHFADFAILNERKELLLIEIERPNLLLLRKDGNITAELQHAFGQVRDWFQVFDDHRAAALDAWGIKLAEVAKVRGVVIAGRTPNDESAARQLRSENRADIDLYTHDDLLKSVTALTRHMANM